VALGGHLAVAGRVGVAVAAGRVGEVVLALVRRVLNHAFLHAVVVAGREADVAGATAGLAAEHRVVVTITVRSTLTAADG
jgi:hypothetical protein